MRDGKYFVDGVTGGKGEESNLSDTEMIHGMKYHHYGINSVILGKCNMSALITL